MPSNRTQKPAENLHHRLLVEITSWDCTLFVGRAWRSTPKEHRFLSSMFYAQGPVIEGRILKPEVHRKGTVRAFFTVLADIPGADAEPQIPVGSLRASRKRDRYADYEVSLVLPQPMFEPLLVSLTTASKFLHLWTSGDLSKRAEITEYCFSRYGWDAAPE